MYRTFKQMDRFFHKYPNTLMEVCGILETLGMFRDFRSFFLNFFSVFSSLHVSLT